MKRFFKLTTIILLFFTISLPAAPKPKYKSIWLSGCALYNGYTVKKIPEGEGKLVVYNSRDIDVKDIISGKFVGNEVSDATLIFAGGLEYRGDLLLNIRPDGIDYTLSNGSIFFYHHFKKGGDYESGEIDTFETSSKRDSYTYKIDTIRVDISASSPKIISRKYSGFDVINGSWDVTVSSNRLSEVSRYFLSDFKDFFAGENQFSETRTLACMLTNRGIDFKYYKGSRLNIGEGTTVICKKNNDYTTFLLDSDKGKIDITYNCWYHLISFESARIIEKVFSGGTVTVSHLYKEDGICYYSSDDMSVYNSLRYYPNSKSDLYKTSHSIKIQYKDGRVYTGNVFTDKKPTYRSTEMPNVIATIVSYTAVPQEDSYAAGVLVYPDGRQVAFYNGFTLEEAVAYSSRREEEQLEADKAREEQKRREKEEEERKEQEEKQKLYNKYGKKYVDCILDNNGMKILVGTPFELVDRLCYISLSVDNGYTQCYNWYAKNFLGENVSIGYIWVTKGKVSSVHHY